MLELGVLVVNVLISFPIGFFVSQNVSSSKKRLSVLFILLAVLGSLFSILNYLSLRGPAEFKLLFIRLVMVLTILTIFALFSLISSLFASKKNLNRDKYLRKNVESVLVFALALFALTPFLFKNLDDTGNPVAAISAPIFFIGVVYFLVKSYRILLSNISSNLKPEWKSQSKSLLTGLTPLIFISPVTGILLPIVFKNNSFIWISPMYVTFFLAMVGYSIIKHGLFDIRNIAVRSLIYTMTLLTLLGIFVSTGLLVGGILTGSSYKTTDIFIFFTLSLAMVIVAPFMRRFYDRTTTKIFFRDSYDSQQILNTLSDLIVKEINLDNILNGSKQILSSALKPVDFHVTLLDDKGASYNTDLEVVRPLPKKLLGKILSLNQSTIVTSELSSDVELAPELNKLSIGLVQKLFAGEKLEGLLVLGNKKSGSNYTKQDTQMINVAGNELALATQNARSFDEIQRFNITLQDEVKRATSELKKSNAKLKALDEAKDEFISMASHQLRTPLTSIKGYISMLVDGDAGKINKDQDKMLSEAFNSSQRMVYLIADLLNVSRLKTGKFVLERSTVNLPKLIESELHQLDETAAARKLTLNFTAPKDFPEVYLDDTKIRQVVMNFVDNAIYYTKNGGTITVKLSHTPKSISCEIIDQGIGVSPADQKHLFTKFYRASNARKARPDGTGLGLYMAQKVIDAHDGAIIFKSKLGEGSTFGFTFPLKNVTKPAETASAEKT